MWLVVILVDVSDVTPGMAIGPAGPLDTRFHHPDQEPRVHVDAVRKWTSGLGTAWVTLTGRFGNGDPFHSVFPPDRRVRRYDGARPTRPERTTA